MDQSLLDRIDERLAVMGLTDRQASLLATGKPDTIRDIRRRKRLPKIDTLAALAEVLETTVEYIKFGKDTGAQLGERRTGFESGPDGPRLGASLPRTLGVYGTVLGGDPHLDGAPIETHELTDVIDWIRRPAIFDGRRDVYALYVTGSSMEPRFEPGDPVVVDPKRPPRPGDDVIVQLIDHDDVVRTSLVKRLVRRTATSLELRQYNPDITFTVPLSRVKEIHRVVMMRDLLG
jgi:SOS-response transcriptional repressor LexA